MNFTQAQNYEILEDIIKNGAGIEEILHTFWDSIVPPAARKRKLRENFFRFDSSKRVEMRYTTSQHDKHTRKYENEL